MDCLERIGRVEQKLLTLEKVYQAVGGDLSLYHRALAERLVTVEDALRVLVETPEICSWLKIHDPKALAQAVLAVPTRGWVRRTVVEKDGVVSPLEEV